MRNVVAILIVPLVAIGAFAALQANWVVATGIVVGCMVVLVSAFVMPLRHRALTREAMMSADGTRGAAVIPIMKAVIADTRGSRVDVMRGWIRATPHRIDVFEQGEALPKISIDVPYGSQVEILESEGSRRGWMLPRARVSASGHSISFESVRFRGPFVLAERRAEVARRLQKLRSAVDVRG